ncbi:hypothetical protein AAFF_G00344890 [Aldrovandia affinis]|uniref:Uncharacterized protein n=1 Tax=Aldrovandia affinis TaxID=143900 RepID=A0AAD7R6E5_9TELE|nr:hypothetical protein AAFF_G00344890 [Aldrovandia affinis]
MVARTHGHDGETDPGAQPERALADGTLGPLFGFRGRAAGAAAPISPEQRRLAGELGAGAGAGGEAATATSTATAPSSSLIGVVTRRRPMSRRGSAGDRAGQERRPLYKGAWREAPATRCRPPSCADRPASGSPLLPLHEPCRLAISAARAPWCSSAPCPRRRPRAMLCSGVASPPAAINQSGLRGCRFVPLFLDWLRGETDQYGMYPTTAGVQAVRYFTRSVIDEPGSRRSAEDLHEQPRALAVQNVNGRRRSRASSSPRTSDKKLTRTVILRRLRVQVTLPTPQETLLDPWLLLNWDNFLCGSATSCGGQHDPRPAGFPHIVQQRSDSHSCPVSLGATRF